MTITLTKTITLYADQTGLTLSVQPLGPAGAAVGAALTTGFVEIGGGSYLWTGAIDPTAVAFLRWQSVAGGVPTTLYAETIGSVPQTGDGYAAVQALSIPSAASNGSAAATAILVTPGNKLATDGTGKVAANNLPNDYQQRGVAVTLPASILGVTDLTPVEAIAGLPVATREEIDANATFASRVADVWNWLTGLLTVGGHAGRVFTAAALANAPVGSGSGSGSGSGNGDSGSGSGAGSGSGDYAPPAYTGGIALTVDWSGAPPMLSAFALPMSAWLKVTASTQAGGTLDPAGVPLQVALATSMHPVVSGLAWIDVVFDEATRLGEVCIPAGTAPGSYYLLWRALLTNDAPSAQAGILDNAVLTID